VFHRACSQYDTRLEGIVSDTKHKNALHYADYHMLNVIILSVVMLIVIILNVVAPLKALDLRMTSRMVYNTDTGS
jgi:hypothetical protein